MTDHNAPPWLHPGTPEHTAYLAALAEVWGWTPKEIQ